MGINGYSDEELVDGPQNGWMGYYSLSQQGIEIDDFEAYIDANSPVTFTDPTVSLIYVVAKPFAFLNQMSDSKNFGLHLP